MALTLTVTNLDCGQQCLSRCLGIELDKLHEELGNGPVHISLIARYAAKHSEKWKKHHEMHLVQEAGKPFSHWLVYNKLTELYWCPRNGNLHKHSYFTCGKLIGDSFEILPN